MSFTYRITNGSPNDPGFQRNCWFQIVDSQGVTREYGPLIGVPANFDALAVGAVIEAKVNAVIGRDEVQRWLDDDNAPINPRYATAAQWREGIRAAYRNARRIDACRIAWKLRKHYQAGEITAVQLQALFGMTGPQLTTFLTNTVGPQADAYAATLTAAGV